MYFYSDKTKITQDFSFSLQSRGFIDVIYGSIFGGESDCQSGRWIIKWRSTVRGLTVTFCSFAAPKPACYTCDGKPGHVYTGVHRQKFHREENSPASVTLVSFSVFHISKSIQWHFCPDVSSIPIRVAEFWSLSALRYLNCTINAPRFRRKSFGRVREIIDSCLRSPRALSCFSSFSPPPFFCTISCCSSVAINHTHVRHICSTIWCVYIINGGHKTRSRSCHSWFTWPERVSTLRN